jgi:hypothetical protein
MPVAIENALILRVGTLRVYLFLSYLLEWMLNLQFEKRLSEVGCPDRSNK